MRFSLLSHKTFMKAFWIDFLVRQIRCPVNEITWTCEHVVPRSYINNKSVVNDPRNLILLPQTLNTARSNLSMTDSLVKFKPVCACRNNYCINTKLTCPSRAYVSKEGFVPPDMWKGVVARSILSMVETYPEHYSAINKSLHIPLAKEWDMMYKPSKVERQWKQILDLYKS